MHEPACGTLGNTGTLPSASHSLPVLGIAGTARLHPAHAEPAAPPLAPTLPSSQVLFGPFNGTRIKVAPSKRH